MAIKAVHRRYWRKVIKPKTRAKPTKTPSFATGVERALRRAAKDTQKIVRMYGTPLYVCESGKVTAKKP